MNDLLYCEAPTESLTIDDADLRKLTTSQHLLAYLSERCMPVKTKEHTRLQLTLDYENYIYRRSYNDKLMHTEFSWKKKAI